MSTYPSYEGEVASRHIQGTVKTECKSAIGFEEEPAMPDIPTAAEVISFERDVKPLFRDHDRTSMQKAFDLWSYDDVSRHADAILGRLRAGTMPCDGPWPADRTDIFQRWVETGKEP
jgi:hypothetical protein